METQVWHLVVIMAVMLCLIYYQSNSGMQDELAKLRLRQELKMSRPVVKRAWPIPIITPMLSAEPQPKRNFSLIKNKKFA